MTTHTGHQILSYFRSSGTPVVQRSRVLLSAKKYSDVRLRGNSEMTQHFLKAHLVDYRNYLAGQKSGKNANDAYADKIVQMLRDAQYEELPSLP